MAPHSSRRHRLPQHRGDYVLVPPPLDLSLESLPLMSEKSPVPMIIVTPSSPSCSTDFSIALLAPPSKPSLRERVSFMSATMQFKARTTFILLLLFFIMACHLLTHRLATRHPHLQFDSMQEIELGAEQAQVSASSFGWFDWQTFWDISVPDGKREFVVTESIAG
ncbi:hypothetical protein BV25DRAFT_1910807 [Artomyces pyxidatus]|uniref:Uncharacterized protein n=1 Tax=Artomyces pyxidatus TaxID=48021 RepID=A0ACB8TL18_9AGAM|nr:hypothetical protein BV25DRAFT_1910807 [Artomyces pyxidatus]